MRGFSTIDLGHGRGWLRTDAAESIARIDWELGHPLQITEAGRTWEQQKKHWDTYQANGYPIALHPDTPSVHQLGAAIDTNERNLPVLNDHGWHHTVYRDGQLVEPWHFEYFPDKDKHKEDDMPTPEEIAQAVWKYAMDGGKAMSGGDTVPKETAGERLRNIRRSTHQLRSRTIDILDATDTSNPLAPEQVDELADALREELGAAVADELGKRLMT